MSLKQEYDYMNKEAVSAFADPTVRDLIRAIGQDRNISALEKTKLLSELRRLSNNAPQSTPLSRLMFGGFGALFGNLISKYFGMGAVGRTVSTLLGAGVGVGMHRRMQPRKEPRTPGWKGI